MILACVAKCRSSAWIIGKFSGQERPAQEQLHGRSGLAFYPYMILSCAPVLPVPAIGPCIRTAYTSFWLVWPNAGLLHELLVYFWPGNANTRRATWTLWSFYPYMILACALVPAVPAIYKNRLYMILACVAKCRCSAWITAIFFWPGNANTRTAAWTMRFLPLYAF